MSNIVSLNSEQKRGSLSISERLDILEEENVLLKTDVEELRERLDIAQEALYLFENELHGVQEKNVYLEAQSMLTKYASKAELKSLRDDLYSVKRIALRAQETLDNWLGFASKITKKGDRLDGNSTTSLDIFDCTNRLVCFACFELSERMRRGER